MINLLNNDMILFISTYLNLKYLKNFSLCNKNLYILIGGNNILKYKIELNLNNDYLNFVYHLTNYNYNIIYKNYLLEKAINQITLIYGSRSCGYYDMRYIFELMYNGADISYQKVKEIDQVFYIYFYKNIKKCIKKSDRKNTLKNINKQRMLTSLRNNFKIYKNKNDIYHKSYIKLINDVNFYY